MTRVIHPSDRFIASCNSWEEFWEQTKKLPSKAEQGAVFERLTQLYLLTTPEYQTELRQVWLLREVPPDVCKRINLPFHDEGVDLIARTRRGDYWAIQAKFRSRDLPLNRRELGTFSSLAFNTCNNIALAVVAHTSTKPISKRRLMRKTVEIGLDRWQLLDQDDQRDWKLIVARLQGRSARPKARTPRPHQRAAITAAEDHFIRQSAARGRLIMPCGTGKSLTGFWIARALKAKNILVAVPSLMLIRQCVKDWTREFLAHNQVPDWICVCSDETVGNLDRDEFVGETYETGLPTHTEPTEIANLLRAPSTGPKIVFTTYQSGDKIARAARRARIKFDLAILDEAHKTVGAPSKKFATLLSDKNVKIQRRVFMTATERIPLGDRDDVPSMDREKDYGKRFFQLLFKDAIRQRIICDYKILTIAVKDSRVRDLITDNQILDFNAGNLAEAEAQSVSVGIALKRAFRRHPIRHGISFHRSIRSADRFREQQDALNRLRDVGPRTSNLHISSKKTAGQRADLLRQFVDYNRALLTNARCLTEGVDIPAIDCVLFADPKQSSVDIIQAAGRALRRSVGKELGYIVLPLIVPDNMTFDDFAETTAFRQVAKVITALSTQDERIADEFRAIDKGRVSSGKIVEIEGDVPIGMKMELTDFAEAIWTRVWESVGRANWRSFDEARDFVHQLGLKGHLEWLRWSKGEFKPPDIPASPMSAYSEHWRGWGDWLGHGRAGVEWRRFEPAREYARSLNLKSHVEWEALAKDRSFANKNRLPDDIPSYPNNLYDEWIGWWDWLGTPHRRGKWMSLANAKTLSRKVGIKSKAEFLRWHRGQLKHPVKCPADMPMRPERVYPKEFKGWPDFLGSTATTWMTLDEAKDYVRAIGIKNQNEYREWVAGGLRRPRLPARPKNLPTNPDKFYSDAWKGYNDFLGTATPRNVGRTWRSLDAAREYVRSQQLESVNEYRKWTRGELKNRPKFPDDIPAWPYDVYGKEKDWKGFSDFMGSKPLAKYVQMWSFSEARNYVRKLELASSHEYRKWANGGLKELPKKPAEVPAQPWLKYRNEWRGWNDWLGSSS